MTNHFKIHKEEWMLAIGAAIYSLVLNGLMFFKYFGQYAHLAGDGAAKTFKDTFLCSGFDPTGWEVLTQWDFVYSIQRHPLLAFLMYPFYLLNQGLTAITGVNCALPIYSCLLLLCAVYSAIFLYRIFCSAIGLRRADAMLLSALCFSFGYVMLGFSLPDHFGISMFLLIAVCYFFSFKTQHSTPKTSNSSLLTPNFSFLTALLFILVSGVSLSNGVKVWMAGLIAEGRNFFRPRNLLLAVVLPALFVGGITFALYEFHDVPRSEAAYAQRMAKAKADHARIDSAFRDTTHLTDEAQIKKEVRRIIRRLAHEKYVADHKQPWNAHKGKALGKGDMLQWTDISTSRWHSLVDNFFGEAVQIHADYLLEDVLRSRPVFVGYRSPINYIAEGLLMALFVLGIACGWRQRFMWIPMSMLAFDMTLHLGLGFGLNECYIMAPHYLFVLPLTIAYLVRWSYRRKPLASGVRSLVSALAAFFIVWNISMIYNFFIG